MSNLPRILIIDDEFIIHKLFINLLSSSYVPLFATSAEEGLKIMRREKPKVVLLDFMLKGMNGDEFLSQLTHADLMQSKIIMISGHACEDDLSQQNRTKVTHFFQKPILNLQEMLNKIEAVTG